MLDYYITPEEYQEAARNGVNYQNLTRRVRELGWKKKDAMTKPVKSTNRRKWAKIAVENGINYKLFMTRIARGMTEERAATQPLPTPESIRENALRGGEVARKIPKEYIEMAKENGIAYSTFHFRLKAGWEIERAATTPVMTPQQRGKLGDEKRKELYGNFNDLIFKKRT